MGKGEDGQSLPSTALDAEGTTSGAGSSNRCCLGCVRFRDSVSLRCVFVLVLGLAVLLSVVFWLPFFHTENHKDLDLEYAGHDIVASFMLAKPASFLQDYILQLEDDIFDEMSFSSTKVEIISLESSDAPNVTKVVFAVESDATTRSLIRANFVSLVAQQSSLRLTDEYLFGDPFEFKVIRFRGGITVSPEQKAFLMQEVQILFNFTLNFSIDEILVNFEELTSQLDSGLNLAPYENLYIRLTNLNGSTISPPTTVQSQVLLAVGINFSKSRFKQLAQTITGSHTKNLGLNNTVFGRVKQVRLSSILHHSPEGNPPGPSPLASPSHHRRHHKTSPAPYISPSPLTGPHGSPSPAPGPGKNKAAAPPLPACHFGHGNSRKHYVAPTSPHASPDYAPSPTPSKPKERHSLSPMWAPVPAVGPPKVAHGHVHAQPPSRNEALAKPPNVMSMISSPSPSPSSAGILFSDTQILLLIILLVLLH